MTAPCLQAALLHVVAEHIVSATGAGERVEVAPVITALAKVLAKTVAATEPASKARVQALMIVHDELAAALAEDAIETAMARPGERVTVARMN